MIQWRLNEMAKQKMKTKRSAAKRFKVTGTGKLVKMKAYKSHILTKKSAKRKRNLRKATVIDESNEKPMKRLLPYS
jgi:large subunit ribosomal protein L35